MHWDSLFIMPLTVLKGDKLVSQKGEPVFQTVTGNDKVKRNCLKPYGPLLRTGYAPNCIFLPSDAYLLVIMRSCVNVSFSDDLVTTFGHLED